MTPMLKNKTVIITGGCGFAGSYLARHLIESDCQVHLWDRNPVLPDVLKGFASRVVTHAIDLTETPDLPDILLAIKPDAIFHLAGRANVQSTWNSVAETFNVNVIGAINLLEVIRVTARPVDLLIAGSGEIYGIVPDQDQPITEAQPIEPKSPYSASKVCQEIAVRQLCARLKNVKVVFARPFNHIGPGQSLGFVSSDFAHQIALIEKKQQNPIIRVGDLSSSRDFSDVRDMARGYTAAITHGSHGEAYNIASGTDYRIDYILERLLEFSTVSISVEVDQERMRPADIPRICGDASKLAACSGWKPIHKIEDTLRHILNYWRSKVRK